MLDNMIKTVVDTYDLEHKHELFLAEHYERVLIAVQGLGYPVCCLGIEKGTGNYITSNCWDKNTIKTTDSIHYALRNLCKGMAIHLGHPIEDTDDFFDYVAATKCMEDLLKTRLKSDLAELEYEDVLAELDEHTYDYFEE